MISYSMLLSSGRGFNKGVYQEMLAALLSRTPYLQLNTVLILPDGDEVIMRGMIELFMELSRQKMQRHPSSVTVCGCRVLAEGQAVRSSRQAATAALRSDSPSSGPALVLRGSFLISPCTD